MFRGHGEAATPPSDDEIAEVSSLHAGLKLTVLQDRDYVWEEARWR